MSGNPICICIPTYQAVQTLAETIRSVINQSHHDWSLHIVDNASTDGTVELAKSFAEADSRITLHAGDENIGAEANFTRCIGLMHGEYSAIFHSDDVYHPDILASAVRDLTENAEVGAVFTEADDIDGDGRVRGHRCIPRSLGQPGDLVVMGFDRVFTGVAAFGNFFICPSAVVRTAIYREEIVSWNGSAFKTSADLDVWLRIAMRHKLAIRRAALMKYRVSVHSLSFNQARIRTRPHDIFLVYDHWLASVSPATRDACLQLIERMRDKDRLNIGINELLCGNWFCATKLFIRSTLNRRFLMAIADAWHWKYRLAGLGLIIMTPVSWSAPFSAVLKRVRFG
jgi:glycosyltransferase involved in cell wall biosynthesis